MWERETETEGHRQRQGERDKKEKGAGRHGRAAYIGIFGLELPLVFCIGCRLRLRAASHWREGGGRVRAREGAR